MLVTSWVTAFSVASPMMVSLKLEEPNPPAPPKPRAPLRVNDLANEVHAKTTNGGVKGENIDPSTLEASAVNGGIEFTLTAPLEPSDSIEFETVNGGVTLALPSESKATIAARCVNGGVHVDDLDIAREEQANSHNEFERQRRLNGTMNGGGAKVSMSTTNGGVHLNRSSSRTRKTTN